MTDLTGRQPFNYFFCTGKNPNLVEDQDQVVRRNYVMSSSILLSIIIYILVIVRIKVFKKQDHLLTEFDNMESKSLTDYLINIFVILFSILHLALILKINSLDLSKVRKFPNYIYVYYQHMLMPSVFNISLTLLYYARNVSLRETVLRKIWTYFSNSNIFSLRT